MRRNLLSAVLSGLAVYAVYRLGSVLVLGGREIPIKAGDMGPVTTVLIVGTGLAWILISTADAVGTCASMTRDLIARRAKARKDKRDQEARRARERRYRLVNGERRTGHQPVRPDAVANRAA